MVLVASRACLLLGSKRKGTSFLSLSFRGVILSSSSPNLPSTSYLSTLSSSLFVSSPRVITPLNRRQFSEEIVPKMSDESVESIQKELNRQAHIVRQLKSEKADKAKIDEEVAKLLQLKAKIAEATGEENQNYLNRKKMFQLKTPKGMRDYGPAQMEIRESVLNLITTVFKRHGAQAIDTPICELKEILTGIRRGFQTYLRPARPRG